MQIAFLTDMHANLEAFRACLEDAERRGADRFVFLGDLVGYGADPVAVTQLAAQYVARGAVAIRGNHDDAAISEQSRMTADAEAAIAWTRSVLDDNCRNFLDQLPMQVSEDDRLYVHADASAPRAWRYVSDVETAQRSLDATEARLTFVGHTHKPRLFRLASLDAIAPGGPADLERLRVPTGTPIGLTRDSRWLVVLGAVGQPRDENPAAFYALFQVETQELTCLRVDYDTAAAAAKVRAAGLPERLASRLLRGY